MTNIFFKFIKEILGQVDFSIVIKKCQIVSPLKGVFAKNKRGHRLTAKKKAFFYRDEFYFYLLRL